MISEPNIIIFKIKLFRINIDNVDDQVLTKPYPLSFSSVTGKPLPLLSYVFLTKYTFFVLVYDVGFQCWCLLALYSFSGIVVVLYRVESSDGLVCLISMIMSSLSVFLF